MRKLSARHYTTINKISKRESKDDVIKRMKKSIKEDPSVIKKFKEYDVSLDEIDDMHVEFCELEVSAKTKDCKVYLNQKMLDPDSDVKDPTMYLAHEILHVLQQMTGNTDGHSEVDDYLNKTTEQEAFQVQYKYISKADGKDDANDYIDSLLDHHNKDGDERERLKVELTDE